MKNAVAVFLTTIVFPATGFTAEQLCADGKSMIPPVVQPVVMDKTVLDKSRPAIPESMMKKYRGAVPPPPSSK